MKNTLLSLLLIGLVCYSSVAQTISIGPDTTLCPGQQLTITATMQFPGGNPAPQNINNIMGCDDCLSNTWIPLGFTFNFYGNNYTQCLVSSNGYITFSGTPGGGSPWSIVTNLPSGAAPVNMIATPWWDPNPAVAGTDLIRYKTIGAAPNRIFIVEYLNLPSFSCGTSTCFGAQIHLYETSNIIETHIFRYQACLSWNSGRGIHGIQNANGTIAHVVPGRNGFDAPWYVNVPGFTNPPSSAGPEGRRWTPAGANNYTISTIPFAPVYMPNTMPPAAQVTWTANGNPIGTGYSVNVSPSTTTTYVASIPYSSCNGLVTISDAMVVNMGNLPLTLSPNPSVCVGDTAQIWVSTNASGTTNYSWSPSATLTSSNTDTTYAFPTTPTSYTVTATNGLCTNTGVVNVTINPYPTINFNVTDPSICPGDMVQLIASGGTTYSWFPTTGLSNPGSNSTSASPLANTLYGVSVTNAEGCTDTAYNNVFLYTPPTVGAATVSPSMCTGETMGLMANGAMNYTWSPPNGLDFTNIPNPNATLNNTTNYMVIGEDANGCEDTAYVTVVVDPRPNVNFSANPLSGCEPVLVNFMSNSDISSGTINSYNWVFQSNGSSSSPTPSVNFTVPGSYDVTLTATSDMGCTSSATIPAMITVHPNPTADFFATPQPVNVGDGTVYFYNTSTPNVNQWLWDFAGLGSSTYSDPNFTFSLAGEYLITLIGTTEFGCSDTITERIVVEDISDVFVPNTFTPNGDGKNESWFPVGANLNTMNVSIEVQVYNRWGHSVFSSTSPDKPWNGYEHNIGSLCPEGVYAYHVYFINEKGKEKKLYGHVNIIR